MRILRSIGFSFLFICFFVPSASAQSVPQSDGSLSHAASFPSPQRNAQECCDAEPVLGIDSTLVACPEINSATESIEALAKKT
jgi:hypothetical protein